MEFIVGADRFDCCIITRHPGVHNRRTESCHFVFSVMAGGCCILSGYEDVLLAWQESSINYIVLMQ